jgi:hypothetical protein
MSSTLEISHPKLARSSADLPSLHIWQSLDLMHVGNSRPPQTTVGEFLLLAFFFMPIRLNRILGAPTSCVTARGQSPDIVEERVLLLRKHLNALKCITLSCNILQYTPTLFLNCCFFCIKTLYSLVGGVPPIWRHMPLHWRWYAPTDYMVL